MTRPGNSGSFRGKWFADPVVAAMVGDNGVAPVVAGTPWDPDRVAEPARPLAVPVPLTDLFDQGKVWRARTGRWVRVKDMSDRWRRNTSLMLLRHAAHYAHQLSMAELVPSFRSDMPDEVLSALFTADEVRSRDPEAWMRSTKLFRRMVKGLPDAPVPGRESTYACTVCGSTDEGHPAHPVCPHGFVDAVGCNPCAAVAARAATGHTTAADALRAVLTALDQWVWDVRAAHGPEAREFTLYPSDVRRMVTDAAKQIGVTL